MEFYILNLDNFYHISSCCDSERRRNTNQSNFKYTYVYKLHSFFSQVSLSFQTYECKRWRKEDLHFHGQQSSDRLICR